MADSPIEFVRQRMTPDPRWRQTLQGGFRWWGHRLAQTVWMEPPLEIQGESLSRVHARTDLVAGYLGTEQQLIALASFLRRTSLSGVIRDARDPSRLQLACSLLIDDKTHPWLQNLFSLAVVMQVAEAHRIAESLARALNAQPAWTLHPTLGARLKPDDILSLEEEIVQDGRETSRYGGRGMLESLATFRQSSFSPNGDETHLEVRLPFKQEMSLLQLSTRNRHPDLGHGLYQRLTLPHGKNAANDPALARQSLELNERELGEQTRMHYLGSWCPTSSGLTHVAFYPNYLAPLIPRCAGLLAQDDVHRCRWISARMS